MDDTKKAGVGIGAIAAAIVALIVFVFLIYHFTMAPRASNVSKENAPDYAKKAGMTDNPNGATVRPSYGQGAAYGGRPGGAPPNMMGGRPGGYGGPPSSGGQ